MVFVSLWAKKYQNVKASTCESNIKVTHVGVRRNCQFGFIFLHSQIFLSHQGIEALKSYKMGSERKQTSYQSQQNYIQLLLFLSGTKLFSVSLAFKNISCKYQHLLEMVFSRDPLLGPDTQSGISIPTDQRKDHHALCSTQIKKCLDRYKDFILNFYIDYSRYLLLGLRQRS